jgi:predicted Fe-Mo cluster-binding NifX family protein
MIVCAPVTPTGEIDPRWGKADRVALVEVHDGKISGWSEVEVGWSHLHDAGTHGSHHARIVTFLKENNVQAIVANHMGDGMVRMLETMKIPVYFDASGNARDAVKKAITLTID